jgi:acetyl esterase/lipase
MKSTPGAGPAARGGRNTRTETFASTCAIIYDENIAYADRLRKTGVPCTLHEVRGGYHGFDLIEHRAPVSRAFSRARRAALDEALNGKDRTAG